MNQDLIRQFHQVLFDIVKFGLNNNLTITTLDFSERNDTVNFRLIKLNRKRSLLRTNLKSTELAQKRITKNVQEATFELGAIAPIELNVVADVVPDEAEEESSISIAEGNFYSIIAGSYRNEANAQRKLAQLKTDGFEAAFAETSDEGFYRVAYGRFESKREAYKLLNFIKYTLGEEAWYLVEN